MDDYYYDEIDLKEYVDVLRRRWRLAAAVLVLALAGVGLYTWYTPAVYEVSTTLEVGQLRGVLENPTQVVSKVNDSTYLYRLNRSELPFGELTAERPEGTQLVVMRTETSRPGETEAVLADINGMIVFEHGQELDKRRAELEAEIAELETELEFVKNRKAYTESIAPLRLNVTKLKSKLAEGVSTQVIKEPTVSDKPVAPNLKLNLAVAGVLGLFSGVFLAFFFDWWRREF